jgi:hypothetical protein
VDLKGFQLARALILMIEFFVGRTKPKPGRFMFICALVSTVACGPLSAGEADIGGLFWRANLVGSKRNNGEWVDPRGLLTARGPEIGLSQQEMAQIRRTIGDVVCPGVQGTAFLIGRGAEIVTNAHIFVDENGRDRANLQQCFWQDKEVPFRRIPLTVGPKTLKLFTRSTVEEFNLDLAIVHLDGEVPEARPFRLGTAVSVRPGDQLIMVSAAQLRMPSLPKPMTEIIRVADAAFEFDYNREPIVQDCTVRTVGRTTDRGLDDTIYSDCSATKGASGSPVFVRSRDGELTIKGIHVGGGQDAADYTDFTLDGSSSKGRSYSNAIQLNQDIIDKIERFELDNEAIRPQ